jgi:hypothetical protein
MDPTENLAEQLRLASLALDVGSYESVLALRVAHERLAELVEALNRWMSQGGAPPAAWIVSKP